MILEIFFERLERLNGHDSAIVDRSQRLTASAIVTVVTI